ncbi:hypothetical protein KOR42_11540 [Thalassoglobus neptunius]|uniref:Uncharacterized protein n=1 Tax=Thalassoglobus neptunius TaxID=1938619 RepID=A0A5C5X3U1_9PLAN|nr:hypothetical protein [Thalassoglobus neptunius]TWT57787.1 hypothetical protein KOR42_11540 [Thalassoglobus neptunius]
MPLPLLLADTISANVAQTGIGLGSVLAIVCSWERNRSILYAIIAAFFSWFYVIYFALTREPDEVKKS